MAHCSVKILLDKDFFSDALTLRLQETLGVLPHGAPHQETDHIYNLLSNYQDNIALKYREYPDCSERKPDLIFERADIEAEFRKSIVSVARPRGNSRDSSMQELLGAPDYVISKTRQIFIGDDPRLRLYTDIYHAHGGDRYFLELQLQSSSDSVADNKYLADIISRLGLSSRVLLTESYALIVLGDILPKEPLLMRALGKLPANLLKEMMAFDTFVSPDASRLLTRGDKADVAYMIMKGKAHVVGEDIVLQPGQLVGEFSFLEGGRRTTSVDVEPGFEAKILPPHFTRNLLAMPSYAEKYMKYKIHNAGLRAG